MVGAFSKRSFNVVFHCAKNEVFFSLHILNLRPRERSDTELTGIILFWHFPYISHLPDCLQINYSLFVFILLIYIYTWQILLLSCFLSRWLLRLVLFHQLSCELLGWYYLYLQYFGGVVQSLFFCYIHLICRLGCSSELILLDCLHDCCF